MERAVAVIRSSDLSLPVSKRKLIAVLLPRVGFSSYPWMPRGLPLRASSRFGGPADLPVGVGWPIVDGRPLLLLAQLNFGDLPIERGHPIVQQLPVPRGGSVFFWTWIGTRAAWQLMNREWWRCSLEWPKS